MSIVTLEMMQHVINMLQATMAPSPIRTVNSEGEANFLSAFDAVGDVFKVGDEYRIVDGIYVKWPR